MAASMLATACKADLLLEICEPKIRSGRQRSLASLSDDLSFPLMEAENAYKHKLPGRLSLPKGKSEVSAGSSCS
jgi:hypothetical protein